MNGARGRWMVFAGVFGCQAAPAPQVRPAVVATVEAVGDVAEAAPEPTPEPPTPRDEGHVTVVDVGPGVRCAIAWEAATFEPGEKSWNVFGIRKIATRDGEGCRAAVIFDAAAELAACQQRADGSFCEEEPLEGGTLWATAAPEGHGGIELSDMSFDGHRDLCVQSMMGAYNYSQRCWLFRPAEGAFVRYEPLDEVIWMTIDPDAKVIRHGLRLGGPAYMDRVLAWEDGELIVLERTDTILGEDPDGKPLPPGFTRYETRWQRRAGQLVKIGQGPAKSP